MSKPIDFKDLFNRVSDNREFAQQMLDRFFSDWHKRFEQLTDNLSNENYDELADSSHQLKGILGNLAITRGFDILKSIHSEAKMKNAKKLIKLLDQLRKELTIAETNYGKNKHLFQ